MASSVPNAVNQFLAIAAAALPTTAQVWFGKPLGVYPANITLQVYGVQDGMQEIITMGPDYSREETYDIQCLLTVWAGDQDFAGRMNDVYGYFQDITVALGAKPTLNSTVRFAQIHTFDYIPDADASGRTLGSLSFTVACQARISSLT